MIRRSGQMTGHGNVRFVSRLQVVPLCARLAVSGLRLSRDSVDFGMCYVGRTQLAHVTLLSHGTCTYWRASLGKPRLDRGP